MTSELLMSHSLDGSSLGVAIGEQGNERSEIEVSFPSSGGLYLSPLGGIVFFIFS